MQVHNDNDCTKEDEGVQSEQDRPEEPRPTLAQLSSPTSIFLSTEFRHHSAERLATMYPDWPESAADLKPLPNCDGPKLNPFDFGGPQDIEFLDYLGSGLHSHVFKVQIRGHTYALKLVRSPPCD